MGGQLLNEALEEVKNAKYRINTSAVSLPQVSMAYSFKVHFCSLDCPLKQ